jgi:hypothetical protein
MPDGTPRDREDVAADIIAACRAHLEGLRDIAEVREIGDRTVEVTETWTGYRFRITIVPLTEWR